jgi:hypothetical protein
MNQVGLAFSLWEYDPYFARRITLNALIRPLVEES